MQRRIERLTRWIKIMRVLFVVSCALFAGAVVATHFFEQPRPLNFFAAAVFLACNLIFHKIEKQRETLIWTHDFDLAIERLRDRVLGTGNNGAITENEPSEDTLEAALNDMKALKERRNADNR